MIHFMNDAEPLLKASISGAVLTLSIHQATINTEDALRMQNEFRLLLLALPKNVQTVHLEISEVLAMSSRGFETLLLIHQSCDARKISLTVSKLTPIFHRLLSRMGFLRLLKIEDA